MEVLKRLFEAHFHSPVERVQPLQGQLGGSGRKIIRLASESVSAIGILYDVREENVAFLEFSRHFRRHGLPVPEIYAEDLSHNAYLEEDLGNTTLFESLSDHRDGPIIAPEAVAAYRKVVAVLPRFQVEAGRDLNYKVCYPRSSFDRQSIAWDLNYFKYYFLRLAGIPFNEQALEHDFSHLTKFLLSASRDYFLYRDFQSRNIMLRKVLGEDQPFFLDYQGGRKGALQYDIASLLYDAKADLPPDLRQQLLDHYLDNLAGFLDLDRAVFMQFYYAYVYVRIMQAMGAYGFRGFYERKEHFLQSVPYALKNLRWLLHNIELPIALPTLMEAQEAGTIRVDETTHRLLPARFAAGGLPGNTTNYYYYVVSAVVSGSETPDSAEAVLQFPKLAGATIGTAGSYNNSGNTITNVFDNSLTTFFDAPIGNGAWVGLDFGAGASNVITQINYCARSGFESRMVGGVFQGANQVNFSDGVTLLTVGAQPATGVFTLAAITNTAAFRYVRYLSPDGGWGNVAELQFYGYLAGASVPLPPAPKPRLPRTGA